jgi:predicted secreted hydrolase
MRKICITIFLLFFCKLTYANLPYFPVTFPRDEAAHYKNVPYAFNQMIEWWYFNGKFTTDDGRNFSYDIALFNSAMTFGTVITKPMLHIQIADLDNKKGYGTATAYPLNSGKISTEKLDIILNDDYSLHKEIRNGKEVYILKAVAHDGETSLAFDLVLDPVSQAFLINENGLMPMPNNTNSYYYSIPHFKTTGTIKINNTNYQINKNPGDSWMDHQWGDFNVKSNGWEWFSIRLENGLNANIFLNIEYKSNSVVGGLATIVLPSGEKRVIAYNDFKVTRDNYWFDQKLSLSYPMTFNILFPTLGLEVRNVAAFPEQEIHGYWEGYCHVNAVYNKQDVAGFSYTEIVYDNPTFNF